MKSITNSTLTCFLCGIDTGRAMQSLVVNCNTSIHFLAFAAYALKASDLNKYLAPPGKNWKSICWWLPGTEAQNKHQKAHICTYWQQSKLFVQKEHHLHSIFHFGLKFSALSHLFEGWMMHMMTWCTLSRPPRRAEHDPASVPRNFAYLKSYWRFNLTKQSAGLVTPKCYTSS